MVGWIAQNWFGYHGLATSSQACSSVDCQGEDSGMSDLQKAEALGSAMFVMTAVPWALCALVFFCLHFTYPHDRRRVASRKPAAPLEPLELHHLASAAEGGSSAGATPVRRARTRGGGGLMQCA
mmetsp:Transcript_4362/g.7923  ORF Transcript_4362/g.7923 Transcript_4362/m.7923 type:complete len:124 (-) Transcript_4362:129-500(-)